MSQNKLEGKKVLHILTGSIAAYKAPELTQKMRQQGAEVKCVLTSSAKHFVTKDVLKAMSGNEVYDEMFSLGSHYDVLHTSLAEEADIVLVAPASADFIAKINAGLADDLASCVILATKAPTMIAPAMNDEMYQNPITQRNIQALKDMGYHFMNPVVGDLVCGKHAIGHIADHDSIIDSLVSL